MFLINSRLTPFTAACRSRHPFFRSYGTRLQSSLTRVHSYALVYSTHPPVSVCGTGCYGNNIELFLATQFQTRSGRSPSCQVNKVCLVNYRVPLYLNHRKCWNINQLSIACAFRPRLRSRLTQGRTSLPWKPWVYGGEGFHFPFRYLCLHPHFLALHRQSPSGFAALRTLLYYIP